MIEPRHPAKFPEPILAKLDQLVPAGEILDPFAGVGRIHQLERADRRTWAIEIEAGFIVPHPRTIRGNALRLPFAAHTFDAIVTSPTYGNRMADRYDGRDGTTRATYRIALGETLHRDNSGAMQWGDEYRAFHLAAYFEAARVLRPGGLFVVNVKDHVRGGRRQHVVDWHARTLERWLLAELVARVDVAAAGLRYGANHDARLDHETILVAVTRR